VKEYHKIQSVYKRDLKGRFIEGEWSLPEFEYLKNNEWLGEEKIDGTNIRLIPDHVNKTIVIKGKTDNADIPKFLVEDLQKKIDYSKFLQAFKIDTPVDETNDPHICVYGEGCGCSVVNGRKVEIQKHGGRYTDNVGSDLIIFDIRVGYWWLQRKDVYDIAEKLGFRHSIEIFRGTLGEAIEVVRMHTLDSSYLRLNMVGIEGLVLRPKVDLFCRNGERVITKVKVKDFK
jgi:hypothetical protein